jgi:asparaginyl-tRNA synthetase
MNFWLRLSKSTDRLILRYNHPCGTGHSRRTNGTNCQTYPVQKKYQTNEYLRTIPHLRLRTSFNSLLIRARAQLLSKLPEFSSCSGGFHPALQVHPPLITSSDCEGAGEVFTVAPRGDGSTISSSKTNEQHYFKDPKYLTVSSQLHLEAFSAELGNVWTLSPTFRAEQSDTPRHLSEFYMYEAEFRDVENLQEVMVTVQNGIKMLTTKLRNSAVGKELLEFYANRQKQPDEEEIDLSDRWTRVIVGRWKTASYTAAMAELEQAYATDSSIFQHTPTWQKGLHLEHEKWIVANLGQGRPIFVTDYPKAIKPFYMLPSKAQDENDKLETVDCFDLLFPLGYCEIAGGSLREHRLQNLVQNMREQGLLRKKSPGSPAPDITETASSPASNYPFLEPGEDLGNLKWYADLRRYGSNPHGGFGMGFDRLLAYLTGVSNVRDVVPFPRTWGRADC